MEEQKKRTFQKFNSKYFDLKVGDEEKKYFKETLTLLLTTRGKSREETKVLDYIQSEIQKVSFGSSQSKRKLKVWRKDDKFGLYVIIPPKQCVRCLHKFTEGSKDGETVLKKGKCCCSERSILYDSHVQGRCCTPQFVNVKINGVDREIVNATGLDNRIHCAVLLTMIKFCRYEKTKYSCFFSIEEECGMGGAKYFCNNLDFNRLHGVNIDLVVILDVCRASFELPSQNMDKEKKSIVNLGKPFEEPVFCQEKKKCFNCEEESLKCQRRDCCQKLFCSQCFLDLLKNRIFYDDDGLDNIFQCWGECKGTLKKEWIKQFDDGELLSTYVRVENFVRCSCVFLDRKVVLDLNYSNYNTPLKYYPKIGFGFSPLSQDHAHYHFLNCCHARVFRSGWTKQIDQIRLSVGCINMHSYMESVASVSDGLDLYSYLSQTFEKDFVNKSFVILSEKELIDQYNHPKLRDIEEEQRQNEEQDLRFTISDEMSKIITNIKHRLNKNDETTNNEEDDDEIPLTYLDELMKNH